MGAIYSQRREVQIQIELHRTLLGKLIIFDDDIRQLARRNLEKSRSIVRGDLGHAWLDEWEELLDGPPEKLVDVFLNDDEHSIDMRQVSPFAGALTDEERWAAIKRAGDKSSY